MRLLCIVLYMLSVLLFGTLYTYRLLIITDSPIVSILSSYPAHTPARLFTCFVSHTPHDNAATAVRVCIMSSLSCFSWKQRSHMFDGVLEGGSLAYATRPSTVTTDQTYPALRTQYGAEVPRFLPMSSPFGLRR